MSYRLNLSTLRNITALGAIIVLSGCPLLNIPGVGGNSGANVNFSLIADVESLSFGSTNTELQVTVRKSYSSRAMSPLVATSAQDWIVPVLPADPISDGPDDPFTVTVRVNRALMNPGVNTGFLNLSTSGTVPVVIQVTAFQTLVANFVAIPAFGAVGQSIQFTDLSEVLDGTGPILSWFWAFGDGTTSTLQNPTHAYAATGTYDVTLTVATATATSTRTELAFINIIPPLPPTASFAVTPENLQGVPDQQFTFVNTSSLGTSSSGTFLWDFGDGATSTLENPSHAYAANGVYTVTLTVTTVAGSSSATAEITISDSVPPTVSFSADKVNVLVQEVVTFTDETVQNTLPILTRTWDFGDGTSSTDQNPTHAYATTGTFDVTLTVTTLTETVVSSTVQITVVDRTALDDYLDNGDTNFLWADVGSTTIGGLAEVTFLRMTSQAWRSAADIYRIGRDNDQRIFTGNDRTTWEHNISIYDPEVLKGGATKDTAILWIDGGSNGSSPSVEGYLAALAVQTEMLVVELDQVPNQPIYFVDDINNDRTEDEIIAYTYDKFLLDTNDDDWPLLLPMVKSAVRGMDAAQQYMVTQGRTINNFVITGASKRGWTTWLTAAGLRDGRVKGIAPLVIDFLNAEPSLLRHLQSYNGFSPAVEDYVFEGIFDRFGTTQADLLRDIIDPLSYNERLTMPKMVVHGTRDEFFMPDSSEFYFSQLLEDKWILPVQNAGHNLAINGNNPEPPLLAFGNFAKSVADDTEIPKLNFTFSADKATVTVVPDLPAGVTVSEALLWQAYDSTPFLRDFRQSINGDPPTPTWVSSTVAPQPNGSYVASVDIPNVGWRGYFVQFTFSTNHQFGSEVRIVPDTVPFPNRQFGDGGNDFN